MGNLSHNSDLALSTIMSQIHNIMGNSDSRRAHAAKFMDRVRLSDASATAKVACSGMVFNENASVSVTPEQWAAALEEYETIMDQMNLSPSERVSFIKHLEEEAGIAELKRSG